MSEAEYARIRRQVTRLSARLLEYQPQATGRSGTCTGRR
jgi:hypothetical protein